MIRALIFLLLILYISYYSLHFYQENKEELIICYKILKHESVIYRVKFHNIAVGYSINSRRKLILEKCDFNTDIPVHGTIIGLMNMVESNYDIEGLK